MAMVSIPPPIVPPRGLSGIFESYDPSLILDTSKFASNEVFLNVYDLGKSEALGNINRVSTANNNILVGGLFHASVQVYGREWCYGSGPSGKTGVSQLHPRTHPQHSYRTTVPLGVTQLGQPEVCALLERLSEEWPGDQYHWVRNNCLDFCNALLKELGLGRIPGWVDRAQRTACAIDNTSRSAAAGVQQTAQLARSISLEVEQTVRSALPEVEQTVRDTLDPEEAQRVAAEAVETMRRESVKAMELARCESARLAESAQMQAQEIAEVAQAQAQAIGETAQAHVQVLGEKAQELGQELFGDNLVDKAQELGEKTQEQARALGNSLWQWGQGLQKATASVLGEVSSAPAQRRTGRGRSAEELGGLWDFGGLLGAVGASAALAEPQPRRRKSASLATPPPVVHAAGATVASPVALAPAAPAAVPAETAATASAAATPEVLAAPAAPAAVAAPTAAIAPATMVTAPEAIAATVAVAAAAAPAEVTVEAVPAPLPAEPEAAEEQE